MKLYPPTCTSSGRHPERKKEDNGEGAEDCREKEGCYVSYGWLYELESERGLKKRRNEGTKERTGVIRSPSRTSESRQNPIQKGEEKWKVAGEEGIASAL